MSYTITRNPAFNSLEITFTEKPSEAIRDALKALRFRWHSVKKVWYGYTTEEAARAAIDTAETPAQAKPAEPKAEPVNKYGVKVGDLFEASWGCEQTNVNFFQVVALVGACSVRVREVLPKMIDETPVSPMSADRTYKNTRELLPAVRSSVFIKDQEKGDLKRIAPGYDKDPKTAASNCRFKLKDYANAYKVNSSTITVYQSWYA